MEFVINQFVFNNLLTLARQTITWHARSRCFLGTPEAAAKSNMPGAYLIAQGALGPLQNESSAAGPLFMPKQQTVHKKSPFLRF